MLRSALLLGVLTLGLTSGACDSGPSKSEAATPVPASQPAKPATTTKTQSFGAGVTVAETTSVAKILAEPAAFNGKTVRVEGMVVDVCPKRGCWFEIAGEAVGQKLKFKVTDGEMVFPIDSKGMFASAQGTISVKELSLEESKQYAEYQAKEYNKPYDAASITKPTQVVRLDGTGAVFRDKK